MFRKWRMVSASILVVSLFSCFPFCINAQEIESLRQRIKELEAENGKLRQTTELQTEELLELRRKIKELEAAGTTDNDSSRILMDTRTWNYAVGVMVFSIFDSGDAISKSFGGYDTGGSLIGYTFSAGKDRDRYGITVYQGKYDFESRIVSSPETWGTSLTTSDRIDIDLAWTRVTIRNDRIGFGYLWGAKYLRSDKTITHEEEAASLHDKRTADGVNEWFMINFGLFLSSKVFRDYPLSAFAAGSASLGMVSGIAIDTGESAWDDGIIETTYQNESQVAWSLNGSLGLQYPLTSHGMIRTGFRGQALNSIDGFAPFVKTSTFYDGHQGVFIALDIIF